MSYAQVFAILILLWPVIAGLGGQGFSPMLGLLGLISLLYFRPVRPHWGLAIGLAVFGLYAVASLAWRDVALSPAGLGNVLAGNFDVKGAHILIVLTMIWGTLALMALSRHPAMPVGLVIRAMTIAFALQAAILVGVSLSPDAVIGVFYPDGDPGNDGWQNILRNAGMFALSLPLFMALLWDRDADWRWRALVLAIPVAALALCLRLDAQSGAISIVLACVAAGLSLRNPLAGLKALFYTAGMVVLAAPVVYALTVQALLPFRESLPLSFVSRLYSWEASLVRIGERPLFGHGIEASRAWREMFSAYPDKLAGLDPAMANFLIVPGHPHAMPLQIWAELGAVGALLACGLILAIGHLVLSRWRSTDTAALAVTGVMAASLAPACFAYSVWNDAFWAGLIVLAGGLVVFARHCRQHTEAASESIDNIVQMAIYAAREAGPAGGDPRATHTVS